MMENRESVSAVLKQLGALNIQLAIDDFGTGYSSLSYIQRFPVQRLKIDRTFVSRMCLDQEDRAIVQTIVALAHNLRLHLVAEGGKRQHNSTN
jgi:EAL domain-containing protein (putative c-di-GMP-specific phosphodiesterase class I)